MTNLNININPTVPEGPEQSSDQKLPEIVRGNLDAYGQRVIKLAGPEMSQVPTLAESVQRLHQSLPSPQRVYVVPQPAISAQPANPQSIAPSMHAATPAIGSFGKHVAGGAAVLLGVPQAAGVAVSLPATAAMAATGAPLSAWAVPLAMSAGIPLAGAYIGRTIGKRFGRPTTGMLTGIAAGVTGAGVTTGAVFGSFTGLGAYGTAAALGLSLGIPLAIGVTAGAGIYGLRKLMRGK
ncbi:MAG: hypothetical protein AAB853_05355 [Patescibacteria group bacterium]